MSMHDLRMQQLHKISTRAIKLLNRSRDPQGDMREAAHRLNEAGLSDFQTGPETSPAEFAGATIEDNPLMYDRISNMRTSFHPEIVESLDELISLLLPSDSE